MTYPWLLPLGRNRPRLAVENATHLHGEMTELMGESKLRNGRVQLLFIEGVAAQGEARHPSPSWRTL